MQYAENVPCNLLFWHFAYSKQFLWSFGTEKSVAMLGAPSCDIFFIVFEPGIEFFLSDRLEIALLGWNCVCFCLCTKQWQNRCRKKKSFLVQRSWMQRRYIAFGYFSLNKISTEHELKKFWCETENPCHRVCFCSCRVPNWVKLIRKGE